MSGLPEFDHRAYGVALSYVGEDGDIVAHGHVAPLRFIAAANHMARSAFGLVNLWDDRSETLAATLLAVEHRWAVTDPVAAAGNHCDWWIRYGKSVAAETPGAFPVTVIAESLG